MTTVIATATEMQNNFGKYARLVREGDRVLVTRSGKVFGEFRPVQAGETPITDSLRGILKGAPDLETAKAERMREKYGMAD